MTAEQIGALLASGEIRANETYAWKEGMADWKPVPESGVLAEASMSQLQHSLAPATAVSPAVSPTSRLQFPQQHPQAASVVNPYSAPATAVAAPTGFQQPLIYPGIGRLAYFGFQLGVSVLAFLIIGLVVLGAGAAESMGGMATGVMLVYAVVVAASFYFGVKRVQNLGMSGWAVLWSLVPIMSIWISWRMFACPPGYDSHKQLDTAGKVLTGLMIGFIVLAVVVNFIAVASGAGSSY